MSINITALPQTKPSVMFGNVKGTTTLNTDIKRLPEEKLPLAIIPAVEKLIKAKENKASGSLMNVEEMPAENVYHSTTNMPSVKVQSTKLILQNANKTVKDEYCTQKALVIKAREKCNTLANENLIHQKEFQQRYPAKKGFSR